MKNFFCLAYKHNKGHRHIIKPEAYHNNAVSSLRWRVEDRPKTKRKQAKGQTRLFIQYININNFLFLYTNMIFCGWVASHWLNHGGLLNNNIKEITAAVLLHHNIPSL